MKILYKPRFLKAFNKLSPSLQDEIEEKINLFKEDQFHSFLKTHKLKGVMKGRWSFSVNYKYRVVFRYLSDSSVMLLMVGDHSIYD